MALKLDNSLIDELGLGALPEAEKQLLLRQIYEKLEMNVGMRLADQMSNEQLDAFEKYVDASDDKGAFQWLESNFPNYKMVVNEEFEKLKAEIRSVAPQILATAGQTQGVVTPGPMGPADASADPSMPQTYPADGGIGHQTYGQQPVYQQPTYQQPQYAQSPAGQQSPQYGTQPAAMPQQGHLQPQYGAPSQQPPAYSQPMPQPQPNPQPGPPSTTPSNDPQTAADSTVQQPDQ